MLRSVIRVALSQRLLSIVLALSLVSIGIYSFNELPIDAYPDISTTQVQVIVKAPGMGSVEVEQRITYPIETTVRGIPNQTVLRSLTKYALSVVTIDFEEGTDIYWARQQVAERIASVLADLPDGVDGGLAPITSPLSEVFMFLVEGPGYTPRQLRSILDWMVRPRLLSVDGVAECNALGGEVRSFRVTPKPDALLAYGLSAADLAKAIRNNNRNAGGDRYVRHSEVLLVRTVGLLKTMEDIAGITVTTRKGVPIHVHDVATVTEGGATRYGAVTRNGKGEGVQGIVLLRTGANGRKTVQGVKRELAKIQKSLPPGVTIKPFYDRSDLIGKAVWTVEKALAEAVILVLLVLLIFLGNVRSATTAGIVLPLTVLGTFLAMRVFGITANLMSLGGLAIAIGPLVDSTVVVVENIHSLLSAERRQGSRLHVVYRATLEVAKPVTAGVAIIVVSLLPILSLTGIEGKLFRPLALTVALALAISLLISLTVIPATASLLMRPSKHSQNWMLRAILRVYEPVVAWAMRRRLWAVSSAVAMLVAAGLLFPHIGREFIPALDEGTTVIQTEKLASISLKRSMEIDLQLQRAMMKLPEVTGVVSRMGSDELRLDPMGLHETDHYLITTPRSQWRFGPQKLQKELRKVLERFPGVSHGFTQPIDMRVSEMLTGVRAAIGIKLFGDKLDVLDRKSKEIEAVIKKIRGAVDVVSTPLTGQKYLQIEANHTAMSRVGVNIEDINGLVSLAVGGQTITEISEGNRRIPVVLRFPKEARNNARVIGDLYVRTPQGGRRQLAELTHIKEVDGPVQITREGGKRVVVIRCNVRDRDIVGFVTELQEKIGRKVRLPPGYYITYGGQFENQQRASARLTLIVPLSIFIIFLLLFLTFRSARQAVLILVNVPFALIGGIVALYVSGLYLSVPATVGFIALLGMAVLNGVVMVNYINQLRQRGLDLGSAVRQGAARRVRPVLMTALLNMLGLVPLLLATGPGSEISKPLATVVVGGTFSSTLLTLVLLPTLYAWFERKTEIVPTPDPESDPLPESDSEHVPEELQ